MYLPENVKLYQRLWNYFFLLDETAVLFCKLWNVPKYQIVCQLWLTIVIILLNSGVDPEMFQKGIEQGDKKRGWIVIELNCKFCKKNHVIHVQNMHKKQTNI